MGKEEEIGLLGKKEIGLPPVATYLCSVTFSIIPKIVVIVSNAASYLAS